MNDRTPVDVYEELSKKNELATSVELMADD
jgi:hypothetical protein